MQTATSVFPENRKLFKRYSKIMTALEAEYQLSKPRHGVVGFRERVFFRIKSVIIADTSAAFKPTEELDLERFVHLAAIDGPVVESDVLWIYFSCANAIAAMLKLEQGERDHSWDLLCEASFYLSAVLVTNRGQQIISDALVKDAQVASATKAALKRHAPTNAIKTRAYEILRTQAPWPTQAGAVRVLANILSDEFGPDCLKSFETTILKWIKEMPDRLDLIPSLADRIN